VLQQRNSYAQQSGLDDDSSDRLISIAVHPTQVGAKAAASRDEQWLK
jgi:hypothetical protein